MQIKRHTAPAAADIKHCLPRLERKFGGDMREFIRLRLFKAVRGISEVATAILALAIKEKVIKPVIKIIMMRDIGL